MNSGDSETDRPFSPPDQFKFTKVQRLKLAVIQGALNRSDSSKSSTNKLDDLSFEALNPEEAFVSTVSTLITSLNLISVKDEENKSFSSPVFTEFDKNLRELLRLFTSAFVKNINLTHLCDIFEFEVDERSIAEHLLVALINFIVCGAGGVEEALRTLLVLIASNFNYKGCQERYFHLLLTHNIATEHLSSLFDALLEILCRFTQKSYGFIGSVPVMTEKSRMALQLLVTLLIDVRSENHASHRGIEFLRKKDDLKAFALFVKLQSQLFQFSYPSHLSSQDLSMLTVLSSAMTKFCPNYRRFVLSKLDQEEFVLGLCRAMYLLMRGKLSKKSTLSFNLYGLTEILVSFSEDSAFVQQTFEAVLENGSAGHLKWYEGDLSHFGSLSLGSFVFCLIFDLFGANLAATDGFKDEYLHKMFSAILANFSQFARKLDNKSVADRFWALFNALLPQIYAQASIDSNPSECLVDVLVILGNLVMNNPQGCPLLINHCVLDKSRLSGFLRAYLDEFDLRTNSQLAAHINEEELEKTAVLVGILKFIDKIALHLENNVSEARDLQALQMALATFPVPTFRRDSRGEVNRLGSRFKIVQPISHQEWSQFVDQQTWLIIYSSIPWNNFVE